MFRKLLHPSTLNFFIFGILIAAICRGIFPEETEPLLGLFYTTDAGFPSDTSERFGVLFVPTLFGLAGLHIMWISSRLDFIEPEDDEFRLVVKLAFIVTILAWVLPVDPRWVIEVLGPWPSSSPANGLGDLLLTLFLGILKLILGLILGVIGFGGFLLFAILWFAFPPLCLAATIGGGLSSVRAITLLLTRHKLRGTYERGEAKAEFNAREVEEYLGGTSVSHAHGRALLKDAVGLLKETKAKAAELNEELDGLSQKVQDDAKRFETEAELSKTLAEIEETKIKIDALKRRMEGTDEQRG